MVQDIDINAFEACAHECVRLSGSIMREYSEKDISFRIKSSMKDLVSEVDLKCETIIDSHINDTFPSHKILGEESEYDFDYTNEKTVVWIVDPIDGTTNYIRGVPFSSVSVAAYYRGDLLTAAVFDPFRDELFWATKGKGAYLNKNKISVSKADKLIDSIIASEIPYAVADNKEKLLCQVPQIGKNTRTIRILGSAALALAYVAKGRVDAYWSHMLKPWDTAAGTLIVREAGGRVTDFTGKQYVPTIGPVLASNSILHNNFRTLIVDG